MESCILRTKSQASPVSEVEIIDVLFDDSFQDLIFAFIK